MELTLNELVVRVLPCRRNLKTQTLVALQFKGRGVTITLYLLLNQENVNFNINKSSLTSWVYYYFRRIDECISIINF